MNKANLLLCVLAVVALAGCGNKTQTKAAANTAGDTQLTAEQLEAKAAAAEAEANRLETEAGQPAGQAVDGQAVGGPAGAASHTLGPNSQKMASGEYYDTITFQPVVGHTYEVKYQTHGYTPVLVVLGPDKQVFSQSKAFNGATSLDDEIQPDQPGTWYVLLSAEGVGAGGTYEVNMQEVTEQPVG